MKYLIIIGIVFLQSCVAEKSMKISPFSKFDKFVFIGRAFGKEEVYYTNFFFVANYRDTKKAEMQIDSFVTAFIAKNEYSPNTEVIWLYFYKETRHTNQVTIKRNPRGVDPYSDYRDLVYSYVVKPDGSQVREKMKNGEAIETAERMLPKLKTILVKTDTSR
jgi:hypothetical protein